MRSAVLAFVITGCGPVVGDAGDATTGGGTSGTTMSPSTTTTVSSASSDPTPMDTTSPPDPDTGPSSEPGTSDPSGIVDGFDEGSGTATCDLWTQDCPRGEKCMPWANDGGNSWNATKCTPIDPDPKEIGEACTVVDSGVSGIDDCVRGAMCWDVDPESNMGECVAFCQGSEANPTCADPCDRCHISSGRLILCLPSCDPIAQDCSEGQGCYPIGDAFACAPDVSGKEGAIGDACEFINVCDAGNFCAIPDAVPGCPDGTGCCAPFCVADAEDVCDALLTGTSCVPWYEEGQKADSCLATGTIGGCMVVP